MSMRNLLLWIAAGEKAQQLGAILDEAIEAKPEDRDAAYWTLVENAIAFLQAGGSWSAEAWAGLSTHERAAAVEAGRRFRAGLALQQAAASRGGQQAAIVQSALDNGDALEDEILAELSARIEG